MNFFLDNLPLFALAAVSGGMLLWPTLRGGVSSSAVGPAEAVRLINREKAVLVDVSEPHEFAASHAAGSRNIPVGQLESTKDLPGNKTLPLVVVCPTGARAGRAVATLHKLGHANARSLAGGLAAWREANLPVDKSAA